GSYTFTPNDNFNGAVPVITYIVTDGAGDTQTSTLTISVTPVSDLSDDNETVTVAEDTTATGNVLDNAETADGPLTVTSFTVGGNTYNAGDTVTLTEGDLTLNADGSYTFTPNENFNGAVPVITYTVTDGAGDTESSTLTISVTPVSDLSDDSEIVTVAEDIIATGNVLDNAETADGPLTVTSFTVGGNTYNEGDTVTLTEGELTLNADGSYTFTPNDNFNGAVPVISYTVTDGAGDTQSSTLTISVTPVSDLSDDSETVSVAEDTTATGNVLDNAETADGPLTVTSFSIDGNTYNTGDTVTLTEGDVTLNADGSYTFTPNDDFNGAVPVISYTITDGAGDTDLSTLTIAVTPVNDPPVAANDSFSVNEGTSVSGNVISHDDGDGVSDNDGGDGGDGASLSVTQVNGVDLVFDPVTGEARVDIKDGFILIKADGSFTYTQNGNEPVGAAPSFTYTLSDGTDT
ncbi:tandem-95 repeat protein, partial [Colwellia sp. BRX8-8]|nr:tandem-95 repeat protein [Colwellia sp. BRX8-8]